jgi:hypothetical protein
MAKTKTKHKTKHKTKTKTTPRAPRVQVVVTQKNIDDGIPKSSTHCMIASAIKGAVPEARQIGVDWQSIRWTNREKGLRYIYLTPRVAQVALIDFECGVKPGPFKFLLRRGQVTASTAAKARAGREKKRLEAAAAAQPVKVRAYRRRKPLSAVPPDLGPTRLQQDSPADRPVRIGGKPPPRGFARREFGMRGFPKSDEGYQLRA